MSDLIIIPTIEDVTRRTFITGALASAFLIACGDDDSIDEAAAPDATQGPEWIDFAYDDINARVPANPKRVVVVEGRGDLDFALNLGYPVIATGNNFEVGVLPGNNGGPFVGNMPSGVQLLKSLDGGKPDYEQLVGLQPDLIIQRANAWRGDFYGNERLKSIAPVLSIECNKPTWRKDLTEQARLLGRSTNVYDLLGKYDAALTKAKAEVGARVSGKKIVLLTVSTNQILVWTSNFGTEIATDLGMTLPFRNAAEGNGSSFTLSSEAFGRIADADLIYGQTTPAATAAIEAIPTWTGLPAIKGGRFQPLPPTVNNGMVLTAIAALNVLVEGAKKLS